jgi:hypothetical protein
MRKQLWALLSMIGLAGSSAPASAQVLKGSTSPDQKTESQIKASKAQQEKNAATKQAEIHKAGKGSTSDSSIKLDKRNKETKNKTAKTDIELKNQKNAAQQKTDKQIKLNKATAAQKAQKAQQGRPK